LLWLQAKVVILMDLLRIYLSLSLRAVFTEGFQPHLSTELHYNTFNSPAAGETCYKAFIVCLTKTSSNTTSNKLTGQISNSTNPFVIKYRGFSLPSHPAKFPCTSYVIHPPHPTSSSSNHHHMQQPPRPYPKCLPNQESASVQKRKKSALLSCGGN
jgi:hypothetical protein